MVAFAAGALTFVGAALLREASGLARFAALISSSFALGGLLGAPTALSPSY